MAGYLNGGLNRAATAFGDLTAHVNEQSRRADEGFSTLKTETEKAINDLGQQVNCVAIDGYNKLLNAV